MENFASELFQTPTSFLSLSIQSDLLNIHPHVAMTIYIIPTSTMCCHDNEVVDLKQKKCETNCQAGLLQCKQTLK